MSKLLPVGTLVQVTPFAVRDERPYRGIVRGYDIGRTKYHIGDEFLLGCFLDPGCSWAFPSQVAPLHICTGDHHAAYRAVNGHSIRVGERILDKTVVSRGPGTISVPFTNLVTGKLVRDPGNRQWTLPCKSDVYLLGNGDEPHSLPVVDR